MLDVFKARWHAKLLPKIHAPLFSDLSTHIYRHIHGTRSTPNTRAILDYSSLVQNDYARCA
jgi:hypothetical protein